MRVGAEQETMDSSSDDDPTDDPVLFIIHVVGFGSGSLGVNVHDSVHDSVGRMADPKDVAYVLQRAAGMLLTAIADASLVDLMDAAGTAGAVDDGACPPDGTRVQ